MARAFVAGYLLGKGCVDCGEAETLLLDFDHRDPALKRLGVSRLVQKGYGVKTITAEIEKCDIRCVSCHRRRTAKQEGWTR